MPLHRSLSTQKLVYYVKGLSLDSRKHSKLSTFYINAIHVCHSACDLRFPKGILNASDNVLPPRIVPELKKTHIHQKQRKARAISESLILLLMYSLYRFYFWGCATINFSLMLEEPLHLHHYLMLLICIGWVEQTVCGILGKKILLTIVQEGCSLPRLSLIQIIETFAAVLKY